MRLKNFFVFRRTFSFYFWVILGKSLFVFVDGNLKEKRTRFFHWFLWESLGSMHRTQFMTFGLIHCQHGSGGGFKNGFLVLAYEKSTMTFESFLAVANRTQ